MEWAREHVANGRVRSGGMGECSARRAREMYILQCSDMVVAKSKHYVQITVGGQRMAYMRVGCLVVERENGLIEQKSPISTMMIQKARSQHQQF